MYAIRSYYDYDFGRGRLEPYSTQFNEKGRQQDAANWFRVNPHRLHLGIVGLELSERVTPTDFTDIHQTLDMWKGVIHSSYKIAGVPYEVETAVHPKADLIAARITSTGHRNNFV